jgi:hypothetical protein
MRLFIVGDHANQIGRPGVIPLWLAVWLVAADVRGALAVSIKPHSAESPPRDNGVTGSGETMRLTTTDVACRPQPTRKPALSGLGLSGPPPQSRADTPQWEASMDAETLTREEALLAINDHLGEVVRVEMYAERGSPPHSLLEMSGELSRVETLQGAAMADVAERAERDYMAGAYMIGAQRRAPRLPGG